MNKPWSGKNGWVWYTSQIGTVDDIINLSKELGLNGIFIKEAEEGYFWNQLGKEGVDKIHEAGLKVCFWVYAHGLEPIKAGNVFVQIAQLGFDGGIIDAEAELRNAEARDRTQTEIIDQLMNTIRNSLGWEYPVAVAPLPVMAFHGDLNYKRWEEWDCDFIPQWYFNVLPNQYGLEYLEKTWNDSFSRNIIFPAIGLYHGEGGKYPSKESLELFKTIMDRNGYDGFSIWRLDTIDKDLFLSVFPKEESMPEVSNNSILVNLLDTQWGIYELMRNSTDEKIREHADLLKECIIEIKKLTGLE